MAGNPTFRENTRGKYGLHVMISLRPPRLPNISSPQSSTQKASIPNTSSVDEKIRDMFCNRGRSHGSHATHQSHETSRHCWAVLVAKSGRLLASREDSNRSPITRAAGKKTQLFKTPRDIEHCSAPTVCVCMCIGRLHIVCLPRPLHESTRTTFQPPRIQTTN